MHIFIPKTLNAMQKTPFARIAKYLPEGQIYQAFIIHNSYFLELSSKLPKPLNQNSKLHHFFFILHTEYHWTAHNTDYLPLEREIILQIMEYLTQFCPILKHLHENPINTPNILFTS